MPVYEVCTDRETRYFEHKTEALGYCDYLKEMRKAHRWQELRVPKTESDFLTFLEGRNREENEKAIAELKDAVAFFDSVNSADESEQIAVGCDHITRLENAARTAAKLL